MTRRHLVLAAAVALGACTPTRLLYVPESQSERMGYAEQRLGPKLYRISYSAPARAPVAAIDRLALRRAAEVTLAQGDSWFAARERKVERGIYVLPGRDGTRITYRGGFGAWRRYWRAFCLGWGWEHCDEDPLWPSRARPEERVEVAYEIELLKSPEGHRFAVDAAYFLALVAREEQPAAPDARR